MALNNDAQSGTTKSTDKKTGKTAIGNIMDDAPLFAGLDDYILNQTVRMKAETTKAGQTKEKKKAATPPKKQVTTGHTTPRNAPKVQKESATQPGTILLSVVEMCALLRISRATLVRMDKSGHLPGRIKLGGSVRFHRETVETWLQSLITPHNIQS